MITTKTYTTDYQKINELSQLAKNLPLQIFNQSKYFQSVKDLFWRMSNLEDKYKILMTKIRDAQESAGNLAGYLERGGITALKEQLKLGKHVFSSVSYGSDNTTINFGSKKIVTALQDYVTRYSELLETIKYFLVEIYGDFLGDRDSFNRYVTRDTTKSKNDFDFSYFQDFNGHLWNKQKHQVDIYLTAMTYKQNTMFMPKLGANGRFKQVDLETFIEESLDNMIRLLGFVQNRCRAKLKGGGTE